MEDADEWLGSLFDELEEVSCIRKKKWRWKKESWLVFDILISMLFDVLESEQAIQLWDLNSESVGDNILWVDGTSEPR